jgi:4-amino-4-deoxy-L-arabinose transferase-like glycosyltransferase
MKATTIRDRIDGELGRLLDALADPKRRGRTVVAVLAAYCAVWTAYAVIAKASQDFHFDMGEMVAWSREATFGTPKHPPLPAWLVGAWFAVFPLASWSYNLFTMVSAAVAMWVAFVVSTRYLDGVKSAVGLAFLTLIPFYNFHAFKFNANSAMLPWWALTTWFFLRSFETQAGSTQSRSAGVPPAPSSSAEGEIRTGRPRSGVDGLGFAALAGVAAAGAMMVKYWAIVLLLGLVIAAVSDPRRKSYFASAAPYVTVAAGVAALSPHLTWLWLHDFASFSYALDSHPGTRLDAFVSGLGYFAGAIGYAAVPIAMTVLAARSGLASSGLASSGVTTSAPASSTPAAPAAALISDVLWPSDPPRRLAVLVFALPLVVPTLLAVISSEKVVSLWAFGGMTLAPVVLLSSPLIVVSRAAAIRALAFAVAFPLLALAAAPVVAVVTHLNGLSNYANQYSLIADAAGRFWRETTSSRLRLIGSYDNVMNGSVFYFPDRPSTLDLLTPAVTPWADEARIAREGVLLFCPVAEPLCMDAMNRRAAAAPVVRRTEADISRSFLGMAGPVTRYAIVAILPE